MKKNSKLPQQLTTFVLTALTCCCALLSANAWAKDEPQILQVRVNSGNIATITGVHFIDEKDEEERPQYAPPVVRLHWTSDNNLQQLNVVGCGEIVGCQYSDTEVRVHLPLGLDDGDYKLSVAQHYDDMLNDDGDSEEKHAALWDWTYSNSTMTNKGQWLVLAYTDINRNGEFDANKDEIISGIVDLDDSGGLSVGDVIRTHSYPMDFDGEWNERFQVSSRKLRGCTRSDAPGSLRYDCGNMQFEWSSSVFAEKYRERSTPGAETIMEDRLDAFARNVLMIRSESPSRPHSEIEKERPDDKSRDDGFVNILFNY